jgi:hypothetical protein
MNGHRPDQLEFSAKMVVASGILLFLVVGSAIADRATGGHMMAWMDGGYALTADGTLIQSQQVPEKAAKYLPKRAGIPDVIVITRETPDTWQVCVQRPDNDQMDCRPIGEARKWLRERPAVKR